MSLATPSTLPTTAFSATSKHHQSNNNNSNSGVVAGGGGGGGSSGARGSSSVASRGGSWRSPTTTSTQLSSGGFISPNRSSSSSIGGGSSTNSSTSAKGGETGVSASISPNRSSSRLRGLLTQVSQDEGASASRNTPSQVTGRHNSVVSPLSPSPSALPTITKSNTTGSFSRRSPTGAVVGGAATSSSTTTFPVGGTNRAASPTTNNGNKLTPLLMDVNGFQVTAEALRTVTSRKKNGSPFDGARYYPMIPPPSAEGAKRHLLCLDIDETLLHATFQATLPYDAKILLEADGESAEVFLRFRPQVREFLEVASQLFEVAIFTASQSAYADKVLRELDPTGKLLGAAAAPVLPPSTPIAKVKQSLTGGVTGAVNRLYREHCAEVSGARVKDLSLLGRPLDRVILIDNSPVTYIFQPRNAIPISSFFESQSDRELPKLIPLLRKLADAESVYDVLDPYNASQLSQE